MLKKLKSKRAETLLETLVSIVIAVLSITLLTTAVMAAARINRVTADADATYKSELADAETGRTTFAEHETITITFDAGLCIAPEAVTVTVYGSGDYASYEREVAP